MQQVLSQSLTLKILDYFELTKPKLSMLVVFTAFCGWCFTPGMVVDLNTFKVMFSIFLLVGGSAAFNCYLERDIDSEMERTKNRALPSGKISPNSALAFSIVMILLSLILISWQANILTALLGLIGAVTYILLYTPLKKIGHYAVYVGAIPGAIPPVMGQVAVANEINGLSLFLFGLLFIWQIPHFFAISIVYSHDYEKAGFSVFPTLYGRKKTIFAIILYTLLLVTFITYPLISATDRLTPVFLAGGINILFLGVALVGLYFLNERKDFLVWGKLYFKASVIYLPLILICIFLASPFGF